MVGLGRRSGGRCLNGQVSPRTVHSVSRQITEYGCLGNIKFHVQWLSLAGFVL